MGATCHLGTVIVHLYGNEGTCALDAGGLTVSEGLDLPGSAFVFGLLADVAWMIESNSWG